MNILKINGGKVEIRRKNGTFVNNMGSGDAVMADFNSDQSLVVITTIKGKVELRRANGFFVINIVNTDALSARWMGEEIMITTTKGKVELRRPNGTFIRYI